MDSGVSRGSLQVLQSNTFTRRFTIFYNQAGNATQEVFHGRAAGTLSNSVTGKSVPFEGAWTSTLTFATPGDFSTVTVTVTGQVYTVASSCTMLEESSSHQTAPSPLRPVLTKCLLIRSKTHAISAWICT